MVTTLKFLITYNHLLGYTGPERVALAKIEVTVLSTILFVFHLPSISIMQPLHLGSGQ